MELTAAGTFFLYFPLKNHFEQNFHVAHRLDRYRAGRRMDYDTSTPEIIADAMVAALRSPVSYAPVEADGAGRAARACSPSSLRRRFPAIDESGWRHRLSGQGSGPTIVLLPGSCSTGAAWRPVIAAWNDRFRTVTTSLLGYGGTAERRTAADPSSGTKLPSPKP